MRELGIFMKWNLKINLKIQASATFYGKQRYFKKDLC